MKKALLIIGFCCGILFSAACDSEKEIYSSGDESVSEISSESEIKENIQMIPAAEAAVEETPQVQESIPETPEEIEAAEESPALPDIAGVKLDPDWEFASYSVINSGSAVMYRASENRKDIVIGVNAGHGTAGGDSVYTYCHPDQTPKVTGGTNAEGSIMARAVSSGMTMYDGTPEKSVALREAQILKELLLNNGYDVLMLRDDDDVQLDNIARTVICNNSADCHIALHWDGDSLSYDKGAYYMAVPDAIKGMYPVSEIWQEDNRLGECLIEGLRNKGVPIFEGGSIPSDLTQTSFSKIPSAVIELGNAASDHGDAALTQRAEGILAGLNMYFS